MTKRNRSHQRTLKIENILLVIQHNGEFAFEIPNSISTDKLLRFKMEYAEEIEEFKNPQS